MTTINQRWARERNYNKGSIAGMLSRCRSLSTDNSMTPVEKVDLRNICYILEGILHGWERSHPESKILFIERSK